MQMVGSILWHAEKKPIRNAVNYGYARRCKLSAQALHALSLGDVRFLLPAKKPAKFVSCLAPYLKLGIQHTGDEMDRGQQARADAEQLICLLNVLSRILPRLPALPPRAAQEMESDLMHAIRTHTFRTVRA